MFKLLIIYYEKDHPLPSLSMIPWKTIGINTVHEAFSTEEAINIIKTNPIDVLLVYCNLANCKPEIVNWVQDYSNYIACILLNDSQDHRQKESPWLIPQLSKPFSQEDLLRTVKNVVQEIQTKWEEVVYRKRELNTLEDHLLILQKYFLRGRIKEKLLTTKQFLKSAQILEFTDALDSPMCLLLIRIDDQLGQFNDHHSSLFELSIYKIMNELLSKDFHIYYCIDDYDYMVVMISYRYDSPDYGSGQFEPIERIMLQLQHYGQLYLSISLSVLISKIGIFPDELPDIYNSSVHTFRQKIADDREVIMKETTITSMDNIQHLTSLYSSPMLIHLLETGQWNRVFAKLDTIFLELNERWNDSHEHLLETYFHIAGAFSNFVHSNNQLMKDVLGENYRKMLNLEHFHTISQIQKWAYETVDIFKNAQVSEMQHSRSLQVKKIHDYVQDHIDQASLQSISNHLNLNQSYLSKLYKDETGENLSEYLFRIRMQRAALLLKQTDKKVYEVAQELGYFKVSYFIKLFRDFHGLTPQRFRES